MTCSGPSCDRPVHARGLCIGHTSQLRRTGVLVPIRAKTPRPPQPPRRPIRSTDATIDEVRWLAAAGECKERIADRLGMSLAAVEGAFRRRGLADEWRAIPSLADISPTPYR